MSWNKEYLAVEEFIFKEMETTEAKQRLDEDTQVLASDHCEICDAPAFIKCKNCGLAWYCTTFHQNAHAFLHSVSCNFFTGESTEDELHQLQTYAKHVRLLDHNVHPFGLYHVVHEALRALSRPRLTSFWTIQWCRRVIRAFYHNDLVSTDIFSKQTEHPLHHCWRNNDQLLALAILRHPKMDWSDPRIVSFFMDLQHEFFIKGSMRSIAGLFIRILPTSALLSFSLCSSSVREDPVFRIKNVGTCTLLGTLIMKHFEGISGIAPVLRERFGRDSNGLDFKLKCPRCKQSLFDALLEFRLKPLSQEIFRSAVSLAVIPYLTYEEYNDRRVNHANFWLGMYEQAERYRNEQFISLHSQFSTIIGLCRLVLEYANPLCVDIK
jgi:hypothetical protein